MKINIQNDLLGYVYVCIRPISNDIHAFLAYFELQNWWEFLLFPVLIIQVN